MIVFEGFVGRTATFVPVRKSLCWVSVQINNCIWYKTVQCEKFIGTLLDCTAALIGTAQVSFWATKKK